MTNFEELQAISLEFLHNVSNKLDPYTSKKGIIRYDGNNKYVLLTPSHIQFAKYGRGPGKKPPLDPILEWINDKNIQFENTSKRGTAFAIQNSISKNGTQNYVPNAPNALDEAINTNYQSYFTNLSAKLTPLIGNMIDGELQKMMPDVIKYKI